ncbi:nicotinate (nicotinamide) nucleotide adenylyltransferase [Batrachochytrium salamandrivorans]|nr:nicotinate (nicotinamide) nucleotide adenylyltransferase [Batrachochytrium salamandrivorans]
MDSRIALFGSSFDPPTGLGGHAGIVRYLAKRFSKVWLVPVFQHPFSTKRQNVSFEDKLAMLRLAFDELGSTVWVCDVEREMFLERKNEVFGTLDVLEHLQRQHPNERFVFVMGGDTLLDLGKGKWRRSAELLASGDFLGVSRAGVEHGDDDKDALSRFAKLELVNVPGLGHVSSSDVRQRLGNGESVADLLDLRVVDYIHRHGLYGKI